jgi:hypothetical protein
MSLYPSCMLDSRFLFEFDICHPSDWRCNAVNQRYLIQYHGQNDIMCPNLSSETHLIRPSDTLVDYALCHKLLPFKKWLNITHSDTFIHSPFEFATVRRQKTCDRISQDDWNVLLWHVSMFQNSIPSFDVPTYSIHVDHGAHVSYHDQTHCNILRIEASHTSEGLSNQCYPWRKVLARSRATPDFFFFFLTYKEIFLRPLGSGGELWPNVFGPIAPGICDVFRHVLDIDPWNPCFVSELSRELVIYFWAA